MLTADKPFMERTEWMANGVRKYTTFCPVTKKAEKAHAGKRGRPVTGSEKRDAISALELHYDAELHQMVGYMRRLDGALGKNKKGEAIMDPFAADGGSKWALDGSKTPLFGFWTYDAWHEVFSPLFAKLWGPIMQVNKAARVDDLLAVEVMM